MSEVLLPTPPEVQNPLEGPLPFAHISSESLLTESITDRNLHVAAHEWGHVLPGYFKGFSLKYATIVPNYDQGYEGVSVFHNHNRLRDFQVVAAGGSVHSPKGNGGDLRFIDSVHAAGLGVDANTAFDEAKALIYSVPKDELDIQHRLFARLKSITGSDVPLIIARARMEAKKARLGKGLSFNERTEDELRIKLIRDIQSINEESEQIVNQIKEEVVKVYLGNGRVVEYKTMNGSVVPESVKEYCDGCGENEKHGGNCKYNNHEDSKIPEDNQASLPGNADIYIANQISSFKSNDLFIIRPKNK